MTDEKHKIIKGKINHKDRGIDRWW